MSDILTKVIKDILKEFDGKINKFDVETLLDVKSDYNDTPISTGKRLIINKIKIKGKKNSGKIIEFEQNFYEGVNILIADNLKGKSSLFKILQLALTGDNKLKNDIKTWIKNIIVGFQVSDRHYTIEINIPSERINGGLYGVNIDTYEKNKDDCKNEIFYATSYESYKKEIQKFFFSQFSYYSLKWTQKASQKDKNELNEAKASWKTYFKSIYLESKDSTSFVYGAQNKKVFQMLLGLEFTQVINQLTVKKEMLEFQFSKLADVDHDDEIEEFNIMQEKLKQDLNLVVAELSKIYTSENSIELRNLQSKQDNILASMNENSIKREKYSIEFNNYLNERQIKDKQVKEYDQEESRISKEIIKTLKRINDLNEYVELGQFFSNLEVKHCPTCNHEVANNIKSNTGKKICPLCHEEVITHNNDKSIYNQKIKDLQYLKEKLENQKLYIKNKKSELQQQVKSLDSRIAYYKKIIEKENEIDLRVQAEEIRDKINKISEEIKDYTNLEKELIAKKAVLEYQINQKPYLGNNENKQKDEKLNIEILKFAIKRFSQIRYEKSKNILKNLAEIMLSEIHEFGLKSVSDIEIDEDFNVYYFQNGEKNKFDDIAEGEQLRAKLAFYLSIIQLDIDKNFGRHTRFLIIDSPNKEEGDNQYLNGLKEVLTNINERYGEKLQIIIGTATRAFEDVMEHQTIISEGEFVF